MIESHFFAFPDWHVAFSKARVSEMGEKRHVTLTGSFKTAHDIPDRHGPTLPCTRRGSGKAAVPWAASELGVWGGVRHCGITKLFLTHAVTPEWPRPGFRPPFPLLLGPLGGVGGLSSLIWGTEDDASPRGQPFSGPSDPGMKSGGQRNVRGPHPAAWPARAPAPHPGCGFIR